MKYSIFLALIVVLLLQRELIAQNFFSQDQQVIETQFINALELDLMHVRGDSSGSSIVFEFRIANPGKEARIALGHARAYDREGDEYVHEPGGHFFHQRVPTDLYRQVTLKVSGVPSELRYLRQLKISVFNENTLQETVAEFRNLTIER